MNIHNYKSESIYHEKIIIALLAGYIVALDTAAQISEKAFQEWNKQKYSMFIHLGIYSELGGVWERKPVTSGYSEQIQSFAGIFSDWYGDCMVSGRIGNTTYW